MNALYRLEDAILGPLGRLLDGAVMPTLARLVFLATLATFFWASAMTKLGEGIGGIFSPSSGAYVQILPAQMEAVGYDDSQLGLLADLVVLAGMWAEFVIPALIVLGLFTRAASLAMIGFILVMSVVDIAGHGADVATIGMWFDNVPDAKILDQRLLWIFLLLIPIARGAGPVSLDALLRRGSG
ncbi:MAG: DoxX family protein [Alphaproteobacteria bacterium]|nr:DoxX family protein [Alphaproteobacteria bacterium]